MAVLCVPFAWEMSVLTASGAGMKMRRLLLCAKSSAERS